MIPEIYNFSKISLLNLNWKPLVTVKDLPLTELKGKKVKEKM